MLLVTLHSVSTIPPFSRSCLTILSSVTGMSRNTYNHTVLTHLLTEHERDDFQDVHAQVAFLFRAGNVEQHVLQPTDVHNPATQQTA